MSDSGFGLQGGGTNSVGFTLVDGNGTIRIMNKLFKET